MTLSERRVPRWLFGWANRFSDTWGSLPAVPVLYFFMFLGTVQIIATSTPGQVLHAPYWVSMLWRGSALCSPMLVVLAWYLVTHRAGRQRLFGLWMRFAGDFGQAIALAVFLTMRLAYTPVHDDAHIFLMYIVGGVFTFVTMLVIRDVWILRRVQEIAAYIERLNEAGVSLEDE
jgi:hypothetical protein